MLERASIGTDGGADMERPAPARLVCGAAECPPSDGDSFEPAFREATYFVRFIKASENDAECGFWLAVGVVVTEWYASKRHVRQQSDHEGSVEREPHMGVLDK